jgi:DNA-binding transcriptional regulator LsrR (DeoR family)
MGCESTDIRAKVIQLHKSGVPSSHIARKLGIPRREVNRVLKEVGG